jgi:hypothetical protein
MRAVPMRTTRALCLLSCLLVWSACGEEANPPTQAPDLSEDAADGDTNPQEDLGQDLQDLDLVEEVSPDLPPDLPEEVGEDLADLAPPDADAQEDPVDDLTPDLPPEDLADLPPEDLADLIEDAPEDLPDRVEDLPDLVEDLPDLIEDLPDLVEDLPDLIEDLPDLPEEEAGPDPCADFALEWASWSLLPLYSAELGASGGSGDYRWGFAPEGNRSGGLIDESSGFYLAGAVGGVVDTLQVEDLGCDLRLEAEVEVVSPLQVAPLRPNLPLGERLCFAVEGGSDDLQWALVQAGSGASAQSLVDGCYEAGSIQGEDVLQITDARTGQVVEVRVQVRRGELALAVTTPRLFLPPGQGARLEVSGGSGHYDFTPRGDARPLLEAVEGAPYDARLVVAGQEAGAGRVRVRDRFLPALEAEVEVITLAAAGHNPEPYGTHTDDNTLFTPGDVDGDGIEDLLFATRGSSLNGMFNGAVFLYRGLPGGQIEASPSQVITGRDRYDYLGSAAAAGDFNNDGCPDLAIGAYARDTPLGDAGAVEIWLGCGAADEELTEYTLTRRRDNGLDPASERGPLGRWRTIPGAASSDLFGYAVAVGDLDGDGRDDLVASATRADGDQVNEGRIYVFLNGDDGLQTDEAAWTIDGRVLQPDGALASLRDLEYGWRLEIADLNQDGCGDLLVGAPNWDSLQGYVALHLSEPSPNPDRRCILPDAPALGVVPHADDRVRAGRLGWRLGIADLNGDCRPDLVMTLLTVRAAARGNTSAGGASIFLNDPTWSAARPRLVTRRDADLVLEGDDNDQMGSGLAIGDVTGDGITDLVLGARFGESTGTGVDTGEVRIYPGLADAEGCQGPGEGAPWLSQAFALLPGRAGRYGDYLGQAVGIGPDINQDGVAELVLFEDRGPASGSDDPRDHRGRLGWLPGGSTEWALDAVRPLQLPMSGGDELFGWSVYRAGDVNEDGYVDWVVGAPNADRAEVRPNDVVPRASAGAAWLLLGGPDGVDPRLALRFADYDNHTDADTLGYAVAAGDIDGDGAPDVALAAPSEDSVGAYCQRCRIDNTTRNDTGAVYIYRGGAPMIARLGDDPLAEPVANNPDFVVCGPQTNSSLIGRRLRADFDFDGDGRDDLLLTNPSWNGSRGRAWAVSSAALTPDAPVLCMSDAHELGTGDAASDFLGQHLATMDLNGDGCDDMLVGAYNDDPPGRSNSGSVTAWLGAGGSGCLSQRAQVVLVGAVNNDNMGFGLAVGDFDGDGVQDLAVASSGLGGANDGAVVIFDGAALRAAFAGIAGDASLPLADDLRLALLLDPTGVANNNFGIDLRSLGDLNGDGRDDLLIGAWLARLSPKHPERTGAAWLYLGDADPDALATQDGLAVGEGDFFDSRFGIEVAGGSLRAEGGGPAVLLFGAPFAERPGADRGEEGLLYLGVLPQP